MANNWIDVSVEIYNGMPSWPGDPVPKISNFLDMDQGKVANVTHLDLSAHTGTHMDSPRHFVKNGKTMSDWPMSSTMGPCKVIEIKDEESIKVDEIIKFEINKGDRIIFKTKNSSREWVKYPFDTNFVHFSAGAAEFLAKKEIMTVGIDYLSVGGMNNGVEVHNFLLNAGIWIVEGLNLKEILPGNYELLCLPIKLAGTDGAPARALLRPIA